MIFRRFRVWQLLLLIFMISFFLVSFTGCSANNVVSDNGKKLKLSMKDIKNDKRTGFFVKSGKTFTPVFQNAEGYAGASDSASSERYLWFVNDKSSNFLNLIPKVTDKSKLVCVYNDSSDIPDAFTLEQYSFKGHTIGCHVTVSENSQNLYLEKDDALNGSDAENTISSISGAGDSIEIAQINQDKNLPIENVDTNINMILGLEESAKYIFGYYVGTEFKESVLIADTAVFQSERMIPLKNPLKKTDKGYFEVTLPANLDNGYYYICGLGLFEYSR